MTQKARTHHSSDRNREIRAAKKGSASDAIGALCPGYDAYILTYGQFSLIDALVVILDQTGPAHVAIATWTAADAHLEKAAQLLSGANVLSMRWLVDRSFLTRQPDYCAKMRRLFGDNCIRTLRSHAKFLVIENGDWHIAVRTSMNLNENPRLENIEISDDTRLCEFLTTIVDDVFAEQSPGVFNAEIPTLESIENVGVDGTVEMGTISTIGLTPPSIG